MATRPYPPHGREQQRHFGCAEYDDCLTLAAKEQWAGMDCSQCPQSRDVVMDVLKLARGPETLKARPYARPRGKPAEDTEPEALAVLAALAKAEATHNRPASPRAVGAYLGIGGKGAALLLTDLEHRGMVRRVTQLNGGACSLWSLK